MTKTTDIQIKQVSCSTTHINYRTAVKFGGRVVSDVVRFDVEATVETRDGRVGSGSGSIPMGNVWAWPSAVLAGEQTLAGMIELSQRLVTEADNCSAVGHPLEVTHLLAGDYERVAGQVQTDMKLSEPVPRLAQLVSASPVEAAIHDAYGKTLGENSYNLLGPEFVNTDLAHYLTDEFRGEYLDRYTLRAPKSRMPLYHLIGALDPLTDGDIDKRLDDGLPETLGEWIVADGLTHLKIKLSGDDLKWDVDRVRIGGPRGGGSTSGARVYQLVLLVGLQREMRERAVRAGLPDSGPRAIAAGAGARPVYRTADPSRSTSQSRKSHARGRQDQAGGDR